MGIFMKDWWRKYKWGISLLLYAVVACFTALIILEHVDFSKVPCIGPWIKKIFVQDNANTATFLGYIAGAIAIALAVKIYHYQTKDLSDNLKKLEHMAFSMKKVGEEDFDKTVAELCTIPATHLLVVSRYSAIPGFWINKRNDIMPKIEKMLNQNVDALFIGPTKQLLNKYAQEVATYKNNTDVTDTLTENYDCCLNTYGIKDKVRYTDKLKDMAVNAIMLKRKSPNIYNSKHEVIFFGESETKDKSIPEVLHFPQIYYSPLSLMAKLWKFELEQVLNSSHDKKWLNDFYNES